MHCSHGVTLLPYHPVPHEPNGKAAYGGSFMEEADWWKKPRETSSLGAFKAAMLGIFYLASVKAHNPQLWSRTFALGLYLVTGAVGLAMLAGILTAITPSLVELTVNAMADVRASYIDWDWH